MISEYTEQVLISWLSEYKYCERRFLLKVVEQSDGTNEYMAEGTADHMSVHREKVEKRKALIKVTGMTVYSRALGLYGVCDCVEFKKSDDGVFVPSFSDKYVLTPIEYKHGKIRDSKEYNLQLAAQAVCLEEMYNCKISSGYVYYTDSKRRFEVQITEEIKEDVKKVTEEIKDFVVNPHDVEPNYMRRCQKCSVYEVCAPKNRMTKKYMSKLRERVRK